MLAALCPNKLKQPSKQASSLSDVDMDKIFSNIGELNFPPETEAILRDTQPEELAQFLTLTPEQITQIREQNAGEEERRQLVEEKGRAQSQIQGVL